MIHQRQHLTLTQNPAVVRPAAPRRPFAIAEDVLAVLLLPVNLIIAIAALVYWVVAAVIQGDDEG